MDILEELRRVIRLEARALTHLEESLSTRFEEAVRMLKACEGIGILKGLFHWTEKYRMSRAVSITPSSRFRECIPPRSGEPVTGPFPACPHRVSASGSWAEFPPPCTLPPFPNISKTHNPTPKQAIDFSGGLAYAFWELKLKSY